MRRATGRDPAMKDQPKGTMEIGSQTIPMESDIKEEAVDIGRIQLLLAEKRTALSAVRTGIAVFTLPLSVTTVLVTTSRYYTPGTGSSRSACAAVRIPSWRTSRSGPCTGGSSPWILDSHDFSFLTTSLLVRSFPVHYA